MEFGNSSTGTRWYDKESVLKVSEYLIYVEVILGLLVWALIASTEYFRFSPFGWVMFVTVFYWLLTLFLLIIKLTNGQIRQVPWTRVVIVLVAFICVRSTWYNSFYAYGFFEAVTLGYSITVAVFLILTVFGVPKRASFVNWKIAEFVLDTLGFIFISTGSIVAAVKTYETPILVAASSGNMGASKQLSDDLKGRIQKAVSEI
ncbi:CKLF-like MARVEL transmembrane domain-containing 8 [Labeo rohita]|uniref:CKLF-like MARVEL transmembrane domain-containing 8 n=1 Tax=Labeo rohita TaxID=84645 RepID=A0A498MWB6_LABRO|nr:CKLF-like MARVEL transmembrane domain-containing 8 [Labeo rohita]